MNFFPTYFGLDISENSLKGACIKRAEGGAFELVGFGKEYLAKGAVVGGEIKNEDSFHTSLTLLLENKDNSFPKTKYVVASLPEEKAFIRILELPPSLKKEELDQALKYEIEANIPMALDEAYYDYEVLDGAGKSAHTDVMVNAIPKKIVDSYLDCFSKKGFSPLALEVEVTAIKRALFPEGDGAGESALVLDIGASKTIFVIVAEGALRFTSSNSVAGNRFSHMLSEHFPVNLKEAEFMKRMVGLDNNHDKGRELLEALRPGLAALKEQIQDYISFFETHPLNHTLSEGAKKISRVVLTGGGAALYGLGDWLSQELRLAVVLGNALGRVKVDPRSRVKMSPEDSLSYAAAIGLALRNFDEMG